MLTKKKRNHVFLQSKCNKSLLRAVKWKILVELIYKFKTYSDQSISNLTAGFFHLAGLVDYCI